VTKPKAVPLDHLRGKKRPVIRSVSIFLDSEVAEEINRAQVKLAAVEEKLAEARGDVALQKRREDAQGELERLQDRAVEEGDVVSFSFRSIGRKAYDRLVDEHPATDEQQKEARERGLEAGLAPTLSRLSWNADTFPPALVAAASVDPKITHEEAYELFHVSEDWNAAELTALFVTARSAQDTRDVADLGKSGSGSQPTQS
jgi:hypothetical protein